MMKKLSKINRIIFIIIILFAVPLAAQRTDNVFNSFRKLEIYINKVEDLVRQFNDQKAMQNIISARAELEQARQLLFQPDPDRVRAIGYMTRAKYYADIAARIVLTKPFLNLKSQLDDLINRAEKAVTNANSDEAYYLLNQAKKFRRFAYDAFRNRRFKRGEEYYRISFFFARKCMDFVRERGTDISELYNRLELSVRQLLLQADQLLTAEEDPALQVLLNEAEEHYEDAITLAAEGKTEMAVHRLRLIKKLIYRLFDQAEREQSADQEKIKNNLYSLRSFLESLQQQVRSGDNSNMHQLMDKAWKLYQQAEDEFEAGNLLKSQNSIRLCQRLANRLFRMTKKRAVLDTDNLAEQLNETQRMLEVQRSRVEESGQATVKQLYEEAGRMLQKAGQALDQNRPFIAFQLIQAATRLSARIQRELRSLSADLDRAALERTYQRLVKSLAALEKNEQIKNRYDRILMQLQQFIDQGKKYLDQGNHILAEEFFDTAWEQIKQFTNRWRKSQSSRDF